MPEITNYGKFKIDPNYDLEQDLENQITLISNILKKRLSNIDQITDQTMQLICMFSLLDCLAQEQANYPQNFKKTFYDFVLAYQKQCDYLECIEPITLYYHVEDLIEKSVLIPGYPPEKEISLKSLGYLEKVSVKDVIYSGKAQEIMDYIAKKKSPEYAKKKGQEHQFISLIYRMRSKAVHEMSGLGESFSFSEFYIPQEPYYRDVGRLYMLDGNVVADDVFEIMIPNIFIRNILQDCVDGYLDDCRKQKRFPFENNNIIRKHRLTWYDD